MSSLANVGIGRLSSTAKKNNPAFPDGIRCSPSMPYAIQKACARFDDCRP